MWAIENDDVCILMYIDGDASNSRNTVIKYDFQTLENTFGAFFGDAKSSTITLEDDILDKDNIQFIWTANTTRNDDNDEDRCYLIDEVSVDGQYVTPSPTLLPTQMPTLIPTDALTISPTKTPTSSIQSPTELPTQITYYSYSIILIIIGASICVIIIILSTIFLYVKLYQHESNRMNTQKVKSLGPSCELQDANIDLRSDISSIKANNAERVILNILETKGANNGIELPEQPQLKQNKNDTSNKGENSLSSTIDDEAIITNDEPMQSTDN